MTVSLVEVLALLSFVGMLLTLWNSVRTSNHTISRGEADERNANLKTMITNEIAKETQRTNAELRDVHDELREVKIELTACTASHGEKDKEIAFMRGSLEATQRLIPHVQLHGLKIGPMKGGKRAYDPKGSNEGA